MTEQEPKREDFLDEKKGTLIDLTDSSEDALEQLRSELVESGGRARALVHPRFTYRLYPDLSPEYLKNVDDFIHIADTDPQSPLIVYEEEDKIDDIHSLLRGRDAYLVRTIKDYSVPATRSLKKWDNATKGYLRDQVAVSLAGDLREVGVQSVSVAGRNLFILAPTTVDRSENYRRFVMNTSKSQSSMEWIDKGVYPTGCVGGLMIRFMNQGVEVSVSNAASPNEDPAYLYKK